MNGPIRRARAIYSYTCAKFGVHKYLMHIISRKALREFWDQHPNSKSSLTRWYKIVHEAEFTNFVELRQTFPTADLVGNLIVFNIRGNNYRLIASIHFNRKKLYFRHVLTHADYDKGDWKQ